MRARIAAIEKNNPVSVNSNKDPKKQAPDDMTYKITLPNFSPVQDRYRKAAKLLKKARTEYEDSGVASLKFSSRTLRSGDWIVWAEDRATLEWLGQFFLAPSFTGSFRATLVSERGPLLRYAVKVQGMDAEDPNQTIVDSLFRDTG